METDHEKNSVRTGDLKILGLWGQLEAGILQNLQQ